MNIFVFDIETIPDVAAGRRLYDLDGLDDKNVGRVMFHKRAEESGGSEFLRHHLHRIVAISVVLRTPDKFKVWTLGEADSPEEEILTRFFDGIERFTPTLVSWNGSGFDLPVIHYRSLLHGIQAPRYWDTGGDDKNFKWNNYLSRFHERHTDVMDVLAGYQPRATARLDEIATLLGFPGKMGMSGAKVWDNYLDGDINGIRNYCETDVLNTYLVYQRFQLIRGHISHKEYDAVCEQVRAELANENKPHLDEFLESWQRV
ncbi:MAG TPA: 3'-5' exonuclease [Gammaproteobacteria bacterium]|jgi:predicted PolB exonuclease-like 3'-5' exonuclease|nr:3'-5' exonuclease [Gammaproteobacteria bacterium]